MQRIRRKSLLLEAPLDLLALIQQETAADRSNDESRILIWFWLARVGSYLKERQALSTIRILQDKK